MNAQMKLALTVLLALIVYDLVVKKIVSGINI